MDSSPDISGPIFLVEVYWQRERVNPGDRQAVIPNSIEPSLAQISQVQRWLARLQQGDEEARKELINASCERLRNLAHVMFKDYPRLRRWEETADVLQNAMLRLYRALETVMPASPRDFYRLAALQIRRELLDLSRHYFGPQGKGRHQHQAGGTPTTRDGPSGSSLAGDVPANSSLRPDRLAVWNEFHQQVSALPEEQREVFDLIWYQGLSYTDTAELLDVCARTVKRRWQSALVKLHDALHGDLPGL